MTDAAESDAELLHAWREGATEAGDALVQRHFRAVFRFFSSKVGENAEELTQRTFLACVEAKDRIESTRSFRAYLFGIARHILLQYLAKHYGREGKIEPHEASLHDMGMNAGPGFVTAREDQRMLFTALATLPLDLQLTLELHYWWGMGVAQIAEITEVPDGTVKSRLFRGRTMLREAVEAMSLEPAVRAATLEEAAQLVGKPRKTAPPIDS
ncbi:MAG: sigma-70 family RNA polymerase sigma factor [Myxococcota bacterium]